MHSSVPQCSCKQILATRASEAVHGQWVTDTVGDLQLQPQIQSIRPHFKKYFKILPHSYSVPDLATFLCSWNGEVWPRVALSVHS